MELLFELIRSLGALADTAKSGWDSAWLPTSYFKRSRAVSTHMNDQTESIMTSIFGRKPTRWEKMTRPSKDRKHSEQSPQKPIAGAARQAAEEPTNKIYRMRKKDKRFKR